MDFLSNHSSESRILLGLLRHGPTAKRDPEEYPDDDARPLTSKGRKTVKHCAHGLADIGFAPALILSSPALRSVETAEVIRRARGLPGHALKILRALHHQTPLRHALTRLGVMKLSGHVLIVGHEPWLGECLSILLTGRRGRAFPMRKAGFSAIALDRIAPGQGTLVAFLPPEILEDLA